MPYGFIEIPQENKTNKDEKDQKSTTKLKDKLTSAFKSASNAVKNAVTNPTETLKKLGTYMNGANLKNLGSTISNTMTTVATKYSGIALAQLLVDGKITNKVALDYLFLGLAPALRQTGIAMGYSSLNQLKNAMANGTLNVGEFIGGLSNALKSIYEIARNNNLRKDSENKNIIYFDMTLSDSANYQSETPDRRVENGNDLSEFIHNMPETYDVQAELQDGKRYSKEELRGLFVQLRDRKVPITLYLGDEHFDSLLLQSFSPSGQGSQKGGFEYSLQFKKLNVGSIEEIEIIAFANAPVPIGNSNNGSSSGNSNSRNKNNNANKLPNGQNGRTERAKQKEPKSILKQNTTGETTGITFTNKYGNVFIPSNNNIFKNNNNSNLFPQGRTTSNIPVILGI